MILKNKVLGIIFLVLVLLSLVSADGLVVQNKTNFQINKTIGVNEQIIFSLKNEESFAFHNLSFEENPYIFMNKIETLDAGKNKQVVGIISYDAPFEENIKIKGFYEADLGTSNEVYNLDINYPSGISDCQLTLIEGDSVIWENNILDDIKLINADTGATITTILEGENYEVNFDTSKTLNYYVTRWGFQVGDTCSMVVLPSEGMINNPQYDAQIFLKSNVNYEPTELEANFLVEDYTMDFYNNQEGIFSLTNKGNKPAKNIQLSGDWFSFSNNNFDLQAGYTKTISYSIEPYITNTNQTDKQYTKTINIKGNFETINKDIKVYINYADVGSSNFTTGTSLIEMIEEYCSLNPDASFCGVKTKVIYANESDRSFNVTMKEEQLAGLFEAMLSSRDDTRVNFNYLKEEINKLQNSINQTQIEQGELSEMFSNSIEKGEDNSNVILFFILAICLIIIIVIGAGIVFVVRKRRLNKEILRMD